MHSLQSWSPFRLPCGQMPLPPHSLHWYLFLPCTQMPLPPQSLHLLFSFWCTQMPLPPQSLHLLFCLPVLCTQRLLPPHSLHLRLILPCMQMEGPPQDPQVPLRLPCSQMPLPPQSLHRSLRLPCSHVPRFWPLPSPAATSMSDVPPFSDCFAELVATEADATGFGASLATIVDAAEAADATCSATSVRTWSQEGWDGERDGGGGERRDESARLGKHHHHHNTQARSPRKSGWGPPPMADRDHAWQGRRRGE